MVVSIILVCLVVTASAVPVTPGAALAQPTQRGPVPQRDPPLETPNQLPGTQVLVQIQPSVQRPQSVIPEHQMAQAGHQVLFPLQPQPWGPQGIPVFLPFQQSIPGSLPVNQPVQPLQPVQPVQPLQPLQPVQPVQPVQPQQQLTFPPYGFYPMFPSPQGNQMFPSYGFPVIFQAPPPQPPANPPAVAPVAPVEPPGAPVAGPEQQQNSQVLYVLPQNPQLGGLSSEELEMAAKLAQAGMFLPNAKTNVPMEAARPAAALNQPSGPVSLNQVAPVFSASSPGLLPATGLSAGSVPQTQVMPVAGKLPGASKAPVGIGKDGATDAALTHSRSQPSASGALQQATPSQCAS